jgi:hypothetical protein
MPPMRFDGAATTLTPPAPACSTTKGASFSAHQAIAPFPCSGFCAPASIVHSVRSVPAATKQRDAPGSTNANGSDAGALATVVKPDAESAGCAASQAPSASALP